jgi:hypothetical protein
MIAPLAKSDPVITRVTDQLDSNLEKIQRVTAGAEVRVVRVVRA